MPFTRLFSVCTALLLLALATPALAETTVWSAVAMACTPTHTTAAQNRYVTTGGRVKFKPGATGVISFICPVTTKLPSGRYKIKGFYSQGGITEHHVQLRRAHVRTGAVSTLLSGDISAVSPSEKIAVRHSGNPQGKISFDLQNFVYWVQITLKTSDASAQSSSALGAALARQ